VLDLTRHWAGPIGVRPLGDLGAEVIRIEAPSLRGTEPPDEQVVRVTGFYIDNDPGERYWMRTVMFNTYNYNKKCVALRINTARGREVFERLIASADVIIDNYATQTCDAFGMTPEALARLNPNIVSVTMSGFGRTGPLRNRGAFGPASEAFAGVASIVGNGGEGPHLCAPSYPDPGAGMLASSHALVGVWWQGRAGHGLQFDCEQIRAALAFIGPEYARYEAAGEPTPRLGARSERFAPQGAYACAGDDRWLAVSVTTDAEWHALAAAISRADLDDISTESLEGRQARHDEIDATIAAWAATRDYREAAAALQAAGVPAFAAFDARDIAEEPYFHETGVMVAAAGEPLLGFLHQLSRTPPRVYRGVPDVGEHNAEVLRGLGYSDAEIEALAAADVIVDRPKP
jgi:crotonobetainyl-CoA:carnitine CoA-transferase CaiB-like acyl-CoA transferase